jgi:hypothetical protein
VIPLSLPKVFALAALSLPALLAADQPAVPPPATPAVTAGMSAGDINGKWKAQLPSADGGTGPEMIFSFAVTGDRLTGSVDSPMGVNEIRDGKVDGPRFSFGLAFDGNLIEYKCQVLSEHEISMDVVGFGDGVKMTLTRAKEGLADAGAPIHRWHREPNHGGRIVLPVSGPTQWTARKCL